MNCTLLCYFPNKCYLSFDLQEKFQMFRKFVHPPRVVVAVCIYISQIMFNSALYVFTFLRHSGI